MALSRKGLLISKKLKSDGVWIDLTQLASLLGCSYVSCFKAARKGKFPVKVMRDSRKKETMFCLKEEVDDYWKPQKQSSTLDPNKVMPRSSRKPRKKDFVDENGNRTPPEHVLGTASTPVLDLENMTTITPLDEESLKDTGRELVIPDGISRKEKNRLREEHAKMIAMKAAQPRKANAKTSTRRDNDPDGIFAGTSVNAVMNKSKARKEYYLAEKEKANYEKIVGSLVDYQLYTTALTDLFVTIREQVLSIPDELAPILGDTNTALLTKEIRASLENLSDGEFIEKMKKLHK